MYEKGEGEKREKTMKRRYLRCGRKNISDNEYIVGSKSN